jgi:hypothetical protein
MLETPNIIILIWDIVAFWPFDLPPNFATHATDFPQARDHTMRAFLLGRL